MDRYIQIIEHSRMQAEAVGVRYHSVCRPAMSYGHLSTVMFPVCPFGVYKHIQHCQE